MWCTSMWGSYHSNYHGHETGGKDVEDDLHSIQGRIFESQVFCEVCRRLGVSKTRTTPFYAQSDGLVECFNRTLATQWAILTSRTGTATCLLSCGPTRLRYRSPADERLRH